MWKMHNNSSQKSVRTIRSGTDATAENHLMISEQFHFTVFSLKFQLEVTENERLDRLSKI